MDHGVIGAAFDVRNDDALDRDVQMFGETLDQVMAHWPWRDHSIER